MLVHELQERWAQLWGRIGGQVRPQPIYLELVSRYSEPHRFYHVLDHIAFGLSELDRVRQDLADADEIETAFWFHDIVYNTQARDNEDKSVHLAWQMLTDAGVERGFIQDIERLIGVTNHAIRPSAKDEQALVDIDLAILGQPQPMFDLYEWQIRQEYSWVPEEDFQKGRAAILEKFLARDSIFSLEFFRKAYEGQARANLRRSLSQLIIPNRFQD